MLLRFWSKHGQFRLDVEPYDQFVSLETKILANLPESIDAASIILSNKPDSDPKEQRRFSQLRGVEIRQVGLRHGDRVFLDFQDTSAPSESKQIISGAPLPSATPAKISRLADQGAAVDSMAAPPLSINRGLDALPVGLSESYPTDLYTPLRARYSTRVIELLPGQGAGPLYANLHQVDLAADPQYEAVSYTWGSTRLVEKYVVLNGENIPIRDNLWTFLRKLRLTDLPRLLWIDALSICQTDPQEKSRQVSIIGKIFAQAVGVLAWVGERENGSASLFKPRLNKNLRNFISLQLGVLALKKEVRGSFGDQERQAAWEAFMLRPYWLRTWVQQELLLAKDVTIFCGDDKSSWNDLIESRFSKPANDRLSIVFDNVSWSVNRVFHGETPPEHCLHFFKLARYRREGTRNLRLFNLMMDFKRTECFDRRDKVYAFLSLDEHDVKDATISPDYSVSYLKLFVMVFDQRADNHTSTRDSQTKPVVERQAEAARAYVNAFGLTGSELRKALQLLVDMAIDSYMTVDRWGNVGNAEELSRLRVTFESKGRLPESRWATLHKALSSVTG